MNTLAGRVILSITCNFFVNIVEYTYVPIYTVTILSAFWARSISDIKMNTHYGSEKFVF